MVDKSRDFRGEWKTRNGNYATIHIASLDTFGHLIGWKGTLHKPDGSYIGEHRWYSSACSYGDFGNDLMERKRGNETDWPTLSTQTR
jgi:hypothetical protein